MHTSLLPSLSAGRQSLSDGERRRQEAERPSGFPSLARVKGTLGGEIVEAGGQVGVSGGDESGGKAKMGSGTMNGRLRITETGRLVTQQRR